MEAGTSGATPHVTHKAARLLESMPDADGLMLRAVLAVHAEPPKGPSIDGLSASDVRRVYGLGLIESEALAYSLENDVTLYANDTIVNLSHQFYRLPIPSEFFFARPADAQHPYCSIALPTDP